MESEDQSTAQDHMVEHEKRINDNITEEIDAWNSAFKKFTDYGYDSVNAARAARLEIAEAVKKRENESDAGESELGPLNWDEFYSNEMQPDGAARFEEERARVQIKTSKSRRKTPIIETGMRFGSRPVAQGSELPAHNRKVVGSIPTGPTKK